MEELTLILYLMICGYLILLNQPGNKSLNLKTQLIGLIKEKDMLW